MSLADDVSDLMQFSTELRQRLRGGASVRQLAELYDEIEEIAFRCEGTLVGARAQALIDERGVLRDAEITAEPFCDYALA